MKFPTRYYFHIILISGGLAFFGGCSTYHNITAYFNTYYNAQKTFDEAVREVEKAPQKDRDTNYFRTYVIPKSTAQKFEKVIEKCSKIIQLYPQSSFVDNSILMIGQSYIYRGETESAIRKFREFLDNLPSSSLRIESKIWLATALYQSGKSDEALQIAHELIPEAEAAGEEDIQMKAILLESQIMVDREEYESAVVSYARGMNISADDNLLSRLYSYLALCYERLNRFKEAAEAYGKIPDYTNDFTRQFSARLKRGIALVESGEYNTAFEVFSDLANEKLKNEERGLVELERAKTYMVTGDTARAFEIFEEIDSTYKRTDASAKAYFERGVLYEKKQCDYVKAKFYYEKAKAEYASSVVNPIAQKKLNTLTQYFRIHDNLNKYDSLIAVAKNIDTTKEKVDSIQTGDSIKAYNDKAVADSANTPLISMEDSLSTGEDEEDTETKMETDTLSVSLESLYDVPIHVDTLIAAENQKPPLGKPIIGDSLLQKQDTSKIAKEAQKKPLKPALSLDSLKATVAKNQYEIASLFFMEFNHYDSAEVWYSYLINGSPNSPFVPRALYALSEIERSHGDTVAVDSLYDLILTRYDSTEYAIKIKITRGLLAEGEHIDPAEIQFRSAESLLVAGDTAGAMSAYSQVAEIYSKSPIAAKALYTLGWILENYYFMNDSAFFWYKRLIQEYPSSQYAAAAKPKVSVKENPEKLSEFVKINEIKAVPLANKKSQPQKPEITAKQAAEEENLQNSRLNRRNAQQEEVDEEEEEDDEEIIDEEPEEDDEPGLDEG